MNPKQFLIIGGIILLALGIVGFIEGDNKLLGDFLWFDNGENIAHSVLGVVALIAAFTISANLQKWLVVLVAIVAVVTGVIGFAVSGTSMEVLYVGVANLENPADNALHLVVGAWGLFAAFRRGMSPQPA